MHPKTKDPRNSKTPAIIKDNKNKNAHPERFSTLLVRMIQKAQRGLAQKFVFRLQ
jgi:hypothetical protein